MIIDPHVNPDGWDVDELIDRVIEASLDGVVITSTHEAKASRKYVNALLKEDFVAFYGIEFKTTFGTLFYLPRHADERFFSQDWTPANQEELWDLEALFALLDPHEGILFLSHPYSRLKTPNWGDRAYTLYQIQGCETRIGRGLSNRDFLADQIAELKGWSRLGSCSGDPHHLGTATTIVSDKVTNQEALYLALSQHICWPVEFESAQHPRSRYQGTVHAEGPRRLSLEERERKERMLKHDQKKGHAVDPSLEHSGLDHRGFGLHQLESKTKRNWRKNLQSSSNRSSNRSDRSSNRSDRSSNRSDRSSNRSFNRSDRSSNRSESSNRSFNRSAQPKRAPNYSSNRSRSSHES